MEKNAIILDDLLQDVELEIKKLEKDICKIDSSQYNEWVKDTLKVYAGCIGKIQAYCDSATIKKSYFR